MVVVKGRIRCFHLRVCYSESTWTCTLTYAYLTLGAYNKLQGETAPTTGEHCSQGALTVRAATVLPQRGYSVFAACVVLLCDRYHCRGGVIATRTVRRRAQAVLVPPSQHKKADYSAQKTIAPFRFTACRASTRREIANDIIDPN